MRIYLDKKNQFTALVPLITTDKVVKFANLKIDTGANASLIGESLLSSATPTYNVNGEFSTASGNIIKANRVYDYTLILDTLGVCKLSFSVNPTWRYGSEYGNKLLLGMDFLQSCNMRYDEYTKALDILPNVEMLNVYTSINTSSESNIIEELLNRASNM